MAKAIPRSEAVRSPKRSRPAHARGAIFPAAAALRGEHALRLGRMGRDEIHERRRQAVVGLQLKLLQPCTDLTHASRWESRLDDRGDERGEPWGLPAAHVVERHVRGDAHRDRIARAPAGECSAGEARRALLYTLINQGVNLDCHGSLSLASGFERDISSSREELIRTPPCPP